jgi:hypothetical protein
VLLLVEVECVHARAALQVQRPGGRRLMVGLTLAVKCRVISHYAAALRTIGMLIVILWPGSVPVLLKTIKLI